jgi:hypothetical protein
MLEPLCLGGPGDCMEGRMSSSCRTEFEAFLDRPDEERHIDRGR